MTVYCQNCGKDTAGQPLTFYGNVICSEACKKQLSERVYFRDTPPEPGSSWFCPHCAAPNPLGDPRQELRPNCASCGKPLDPASAPPPKKGGCLGVLLLALCAVGIAGCFASDASGLRGTAPPVAPAVPEAVAVAPPSRADTLTEPHAALAPAPIQHAVPADAPHYRYQAKFEPPDGRILHGMGQWDAGNREYLEMLGDRAIWPASRLFFFALGDWPRPWNARIDMLEWQMGEERSQGRIPHLDISLHGIPLGQREERAIDDQVARSDTYDDRIADLARRIRDLGGPVFMRIGGEFNGDWSGYHAYDYPKAYRRIVDIFRREQADNVAFIWCYEPSAPGDFDEEDVLGARWFPGADVIDWFGLDVFNVSEFAGGRGRAGIESKQDRSERFLHMAERYGKPVIIAETSAVKQQLTRDDADGRHDWDQWFIPFFRFLDQHPNIKAFHYINTDWQTSGNARKLGWMDARINRSDYVARRYVAEMRKPRYLHADDLPLLRGYAQAMASGHGPAKRAPESVGRGR